MKKPWTMERIMDLSNHNTLILVVGMFSQREVCDAI